MRRTTSVISIPFEKKHIKQSYSTTLFEKRRESKKILSPSLIGLAVDVAVIRLSFMRV